MRFHRFFIKDRIEAEKFGISDERLIHQWRNVFRYNVGSQVTLFDGSGEEFDCVLNKITNREVEVLIIAKRKGIMPENKITLYQSLIKKDKIEWIAEKATELGVSKIVPIISERSEKKGLNSERLQRIIIEASEQCGRADVVILESRIQNLESSIKNQEGQLIVFDKSGTDFLPNSSSKLPVSIFIGPEGGWSEKEIEMFKKAGAKIYSLSKFTLRAETAAVVAISKFF